MGQRGPAPTKGPPTTVRLAPGIHEQLKAAAATEGHSLSQEIEQRLARTLSEDEGLSNETGWLLWWLRLAIEEVEATTGQPWWTDGFTRDNLADTLRLFVRRYAGPDVDDAPAPDSFPVGILPDVPSLREERRELAESLIRRGVADLCAMSLGNKMRMPIAGHPREKELAKERERYRRGGKTFLRLTRPAKEKGQYHDR